MIKRYGCNQIVVSAKLSCGPANDIGDQEQEAFRLPDSSLTSVAACGTGQEAKGGMVGSGRGSE
jgi:hypothetical protein